MKINKKESHRLFMNFNHKAEESYKRCSKATQESAKPVLELISEGFQINWFRETEQLIWMAAIKPNNDISEQFGLRQEYLVIGNGYDRDFHQRTLAIEIPEEIKDRLDENLRFVSSNAPVAAAFCAAWAQKKKSTVIILTTLTNSSIFSILSKNLWRRDFFSESEPVRLASEFFGRQAFVNELLVKIMTGSPIAIFGLRKVGKSSLLGRVEDLLREDSSTTTGIAFLLGNATRLKSGRWWHFAQDALNEWSTSIQHAAEAAGSKVKPKADRLNDLVAKNKTDPVLLARAFESDIQALIKSANAISKDSGSAQGRLVLFLDECDHLYPLAKDSGYWKSDFFVFWNTIQSIKRSLDDPSQLVYVLSGVNPSGVEQGALDGQPNPLYECDRLYLSPMPEGEVESLLLGLGERMGLSFNKEAVSKAYELVGGHPLLVRRLGSAIHQLHLDRTSRLTISERDVSRAFARKKRDLFNQVSWILEHLALIAPDEEKLLRDVAQGGSDAYAEIWGESEFRETFAYHLEQYGLLSFEGELPVLELEIVREALKKPTASEFKDQKRLLKDLIDSLEEAIRLRIRDDLEKDKSPEEAVEALVKSIPSDAKNRALDRSELVDLGLLAGLYPVLQALNWSDYELILKKFYDDIQWSGVEINKEERIASISEIFKRAHIIRHNNDHEIKRMIDEAGYNEIYSKFTSLREALSA